MKKEEDESKEEGLCGLMLEQFSHKVSRVKPGGGPWSLGISHMDRYQFDFFKFEL